MKRKQPPNWFFTSPAPSKLSDHGVQQLDDTLKNKSIAFLITGSVAAMKAPLVVRHLRRYGARVTVFASQDALKYVARDSLAWASNKNIVTELTPKAEHLNGGKPFDCHLVAPASYNTINKIAAGHGDSLVTAVLASALGFLNKLSHPKTSVLIAPAMHGSMHNPILIQSMISLHKLGVGFIKPRQEFGKNNLPSQDEILAAVCRATTKSPLKNKRILITGGATPVKLDAIRRLTNCFSGKLATKIATTLHLNGAEVMLLQSSMGTRPPKWLPHILYESFDQYSKLVSEATQVDMPAEFGIFSAAVADYRPKHPFNDKIVSGKQEINLALEPTPKVIEQVRTKSPTKLISFKYEENADARYLAETAGRILKKGDLAVITNQNLTNALEHQAFLHFDTGARARPIQFNNKDEIAKGIKSFLEKYVEKAGKGL